MHIVSQDSKTGYLTDNHGWEHRPFKHEGCYTYYNVYDVFYTQFGGEEKFIFQSVRFYESSELRFHNQDTRLECVA